MLGLCWGYDSLSGPMLAHLGAMLGLCWPSCGLCWGQARPSWGYVGAMLAHLESMLGPCSPTLGLCWGYVDPLEVILGLCCVHDFPFIPKICLKKLSPMEHVSTIFAPTSGLRVAGTSDRRSRQYPLSQARKSLATAWNLQATVGSSKKK